MEPDPGWVTHWGAAISLLTSQTRQNMKKTIIFPAIMTILMSCGNNQAPSEKSTDQKPAAINAADSTVAAVTKKEYKTKTGKIITVSESHPQGQSLSNIRVAFAGDAASEMKFTDMDPINKVLVGDLDANGYDELYIITTSAGSGSYGNVIGIASLSDKSLSQITMPAVEEKEMKKGGKFEGYEGHDEFEIIENSLARRFPIKAPNATKRAINYKLKPVEASFVLYIKTSTAF